MAKWNKGNPAPNVKDIIGQKFGRLTVIARHPVNSNDRKARWICKCDCGNEIVVTGKALRKGTTQSCGCLRRETTAKTISMAGHLEETPNVYMESIKICADAVMIPDDPHILIMVDAEYTFATNGIIQMILLKDM